MRGNLDSPFLVEMHSKSVLCADLAHLYQKLIYVNDIISQVTYVKCIS